MICPKCGGDTKVTDNVTNTSSNENYRQRTCLQCGNKFHTVESVVEYKTIKNKYNRYHRHGVYTQSLKIKKENEVDG